MSTRSVSAQAISLSRNTLPASLTSFLGREQEVRAVCALLRRKDVRLVTLTGPGGVGKTRLAVQVANDLFSDFVNGVYFVSLAPLRDPDLIIPTIVQALGLQVMGTSSPLELLKAYLQEKHMLLLLDNFEQIVTAAPALTSLLTTCPFLKILVTSRVVLRLYGEQQYPVPPLALPELAQLRERDTLQHYAAVALFLQRAQAVKPDFQLNDTNVRTIAEICIRLDGLPLAIELATARIKLFSPQMLLARLNQSFRLLRSVMQDVSTRQQTLHNTISWSYNLLDADEQQLLRRLAVFVGGCTIEAIEAVSHTLGDEEEGPVLERLDSLIDKSLVQLVERENAEPRLRILETLREYGLESLENTNEMDITRHAHAVYYVSLVEKAEPEFANPQEAWWLEQLGQELGNLRVAMQWLLQQGRVKRDQGDEMELALRLGGALQKFWQIRGYWDEGRHFLEQVLKESQGMLLPADVRAKAILGVGIFTYVQDDRANAEILAHQSLELYRSIDDKAGIAAALDVVGLATLDYAAACRYCAESIALWKEIGNQGRVAFVSYDLAHLVFDHGEHAKAQILFEENLALRRMLGIKSGVGRALFRLSLALIAQGKSEHLDAILEESLSIFQELGDALGIAQLLGLLGLVALWRGDTAKAIPDLEKSMTLFKELSVETDMTESLSLLVQALIARGDSIGAYELLERCLTVSRAGGHIWPIFLCLEELADLAIGQKAFVWAARFLGATEMVRGGVGPIFTSDYQSKYEQLFATTRAALGEYAFTAALIEGHTLTAEQVLLAKGPLTQVAHAEPVSVALTKSVVAYPNGLTAREVDVLRLLAQGLPDIQIAEKLCISPRTVNWHLTSLYRKIQVSSRAAATRYAIEHHLA